MPHTLITGAAGFIGFHLAKRLVEQGYKVTGIDNLNTYYDVQLKLDRLQQLGIDTRGQPFTQQERATSEKHPNFKFLQLDLCDEEELNGLFEASGFEMVINLAAQAGVRYSLKNPKAYINSNIVGFANLLEACRHHPVDHLIYASSSSVYGNRERTPFKESDNVDEPVSLYAATKKSNELLAYTYSHLYNLPTTGLRFFTVYGPWGRRIWLLFCLPNLFWKKSPLRYSTTAI